MANNNIESAREIALCELENVKEYYNNLEIENQIYLRAWIVSTILTNMQLPNTEEENLRKMLMSGKEFEFISFLINTSTESTFIKDIEIFLNVCNGLILPEKDYMEYLDKRQNRKYKDTSHSELPLRFWLNLQKTEGDYRAELLKTNTGEKNA